MRNVNCLTQEACNAEELAGHDDTMRLEKIGSLLNGTRQRRSTVQSGDYLGLDVLTRGTKC